jgi:betaine lipid synthase
VEVPGGISKRCEWDHTTSADGRDEYLPISTFDAVYLVDLCEPLLDVARRRFAAKGWKNVHVLCQDASTFVLPEWESGAVDPRGSISAITLSYSLSMVSSRA